MGLRLAKELQIDNLKVYNDSQLVVNQANENYQERGENMAAYLKKAKELIGSISTVTIEVVRRSKNANADVLTKLTSRKDAELRIAISMEFLAEPSVKQQPETIELKQ